MRNASIEKKSRNFLPNRFVGSRERLDSKLIQRSKTTHGSGFANPELLNFLETIPRDSDPSAALFASLEKLLPTYRRLLAVNTKFILITCALPVAGLRAE